MAMESVGPYIRELRRAAGLTQEQAAGLVGMSAKSVERWEAGKGEPTFSVLAAYVKALHGSVMRLVALLLGDTTEEAAQHSAAVAEFAAHEDETPEEARRINRLLDLLADGVDPSEAARRVRSGR